MNNRQTVKDFVVAQIAEQHSRSGHETFIDLNKKIYDFSINNTALFDRIESHFGVNVREGGDIDIEKLTVEDFVTAIKKKIIQHSEKKVDCKTIFENFIFSNRCKRLATPYEMNIDITFRCNLKCIFCYASASDSDEKKDELTIDEIFDIIDEFEAMNGGFILFGGGEPFLREDFLEIYRYTKSKGLWTYIISNGSLIDADTATAFSKYYNHNFDKIQISLDGSTPQINDKQRGVPGAFEQTTQGIKNLVARGIRPLINTVLTKINYEDIPNILDFAVDHNAYTYRCLKLHKVGRGQRGDLYKKIELDPDQYENIYAYLTKRRDELMGRIGIASDNACVFPMSIKGIRDQFEKQHGEEPLSYSCAGGTTKLAVSPTGGVVPCSYFYDFPEFYVGSLRENSLKEIWENEDTWKLFREPLKIEGKCTKCGYLYACKSGCRIMSYINTGSMGGPDIGCTYNPLDDN